MYNNNLYHSGVMGMHWGQRRYQNEDGSYKPGAEGRYYDPVKETKKKGKQYQKDLNKADLRIAKHQREYDEAKARLMAYEKKLRKRGNLISDKDGESNTYGFTASRRDQKAKNKLLKLAQETQEASKNVSDGKKEVEKLLKKAKAEGYTIKESKAMRNTNTAKDYVGTAIGVMGGVALTSLAITATMGTAAIPAGGIGVSSAVATSQALNRNNREGTYYKVKYNTKKK